MEFCPKCGAVLMTKTKTSACPRCTFVKKGVVELKSSEKIEKQGDIPIVREKGNTNPVVNQTCQKCANKKCYTWAMQTRSSDEPPTTFFKCVKCEHTWREYK